MTKRIEQLREDRAIRDMAKGLFQANIEHLRGFVEVNANRDRLAQRATDEVRELASGAGKAAGKNKSAIAFLAAAIFMWFGRDEIISLLDRSGKNGDNEEPADETVAAIGEETSEPEMEEVT